MNKRFAAVRKLFCALAVAALCAPAAQSAEPGAAPSQRVLNHGKAIYKSANCVGCHKWHGGGGGGYGGAAFSLRTTVLDRENFLLVVRCGRPGTGMPFHQSAAWDDGRCYGITRADLPPDRELRKGIELSEREMLNVTDYVLATMKGRGEPTHEECMAYWGPGSEKVCQTLD